MDARRPGQIAHALGLPEEQVRVIYPAIGGAFGGREDMSVQIVLALAAWKLKRPVKIIWSRQESIIGHGKRHPMTLKTKWGASKDGKLLAAETTVIADAGAYMYTTNKVLGNCTITATGPYFIPNVKEDVIGVYTNNVPTAAFRGFGAPQALLMAELQMDKLAEKLGLDPVEFRHRNALREGDTLNVGTPAPGRVSIVECIEAAATKFGWTIDHRPQTTVHASIVNRPRSRFRLRLQERRLLVRLPGKFLGARRNPRQNRDRARRRLACRRGGRAGRTHRHGADGRRGGRRPVRESDDGHV